MVIRASGPAIAKARRELIRAGFGAALSAAASGPGEISGSTPEAQCEVLAEIARYIDEADPHMIGAAWLLEQCGYERSQLTLAVREDPQPVLNHRKQVRERMEAFMEERSDRRHVVWLERYLAQLVGATIRDIKVNPEPEPWPSLTTTLADGTDVEVRIDRDEEGNGPGFVFGLELPSPARGSSPAAQADWLRRYLEPLQGGTVTNAAIVADEGLAWPEILVRLAAGQMVRLEISQDEEGNGPGFVHGLDLLRSEPEGGR